MRILSYLSALLFFPTDRRLAFEVESDAMRQFIKTQYPIAKKGLLDNIGSNGAFAKEAKPSILVSAGGLTRPEYRITWIRDSSLVFKTLIELWASGRDDSLLPGIFDWVASQGRLQKKPNLTGNLTSGGLGECGFNLDESVYTGPAGRPQHDNAALRASSMIEFANGLLARNGPKSHKYVASTIWPIVKLDLDYVAYHWNVTGFNLWEEVIGSCHFTLAAQIRGLKQGASLAKRLGYGSSHVFWAEQADNALCFFQDFWDPNQSIIVSNINCDWTCRDTVDVGSVFTTIRNFDPEAGCDNATFQPCSEYALRNLKGVVDSMRGSYIINKNRSNTSAIALGRFDKDTYVGGNPWYLATFAAAEQLYDAFYQWNHIGEIRITPLSLPFFQQLRSAAKTGIFKSGEEEFNHLISSVVRYADEFSLINKVYIPPDGSMSEQFDRDTGEPRSAFRLSASYASAMASFDRRRGYVPASWGASEMSVPSVCRAGPQAT